MYYIMPPDSGDSVDNVKVQNMQNEMDEMQKKLDEELQDKEHLNEKVNSYFYVINVFVTK